MKAPNELMELVEQIIDCRDAGIDPTALLEQFEAEVPYPNARELFVSDRSAAYILERAWGFRRIAPGEKQREALAEVVRQIRRLEGGELGVDIAEDILRASVPHPDVSALVRDRSLSDEEVVNAAINYQGILL